MEIENSKDSVERLVQQLFPSSIEIVSDHHQVSPAERFLTISGKSGLRWIVPENPLKGYHVLDQWKPYGFGSGLKWQGLLSAYRHGFLSRIPGIKRVAIAGSHQQNWQDIGWDGANSVLPCIYVGTAGYKQKVVATLSGDNDEKTRCIVKSPIGIDAAQSILNEAEILAMLERVKPGVAPSLLYVSSSKGVSCQAFVNGDPSRRSFSAAHADLLLSMKNGRTTSLLQHCRSFESWLSLDNTMKEEDRKLIILVLPMIADDTLLPAVLIHGDFVPWNLKTVEASLVAIDWEDAKFDGLPALDVIHFFAMQSYLFGKHLDFIENIKHNKHVARYLAEMDISQLYLSKLVLFYLLDAWLVRKQIEDFEHALFLKQALCKLLGSMQ